MTREQALELEYRSELYHRTKRQARGKEVLHVRVNGQVRTWKRDPTRIEIPVKCGFRECHTITTSELPDWFLTEEEALANSDEARQRKRTAMTAPHGLCERAKRCLENDQDLTVLSCRCRYCGTAFAVDHGRGLVATHDASDIAEHEANCGKRSE